MYKIIFICGIEKRQERGKEKKGGGMNTGIT